MKKDEIFVFLAGSYKTKWRDDLRYKLFVNYYTPIVPDGQLNEVGLKEQERLKKKCARILYVVTPEDNLLHIMTDFIHDVYNREDCLIDFIILEEEKFDKSKLESIKRVLYLLKEHTRYYDRYDNLEESIWAINHHQRSIPGFIRSVIYWIEDDKVNNAYYWEDDLSDEQKAALDDAGLVYTLDEYAEEKEYIITKKIKK